MKKIIRILSVLALAVVVTIGFSGCFLTAKLAERKLVQAGEFVSNSNYEETTLSVKKDKTYKLYVYSYETEAMETYEGTWSYVMTYKFQYTVTHGYLEIIKTTESSTWQIFKLEGYTDRGEQGYFVHKQFGGVVHTTDEEITESYFEKYKNENGLVSLPGWDVSTAPKED